MSEIRPAGGREPSVQRIESSTSNEPQRELLILQSSLKELEETKAKEVLSPEMVVIPLKILDQLMSFKLDIGSKITNKIVLAEISHTINDMVFRSLSIFPIAESKGLTDQMKSHIFVALYDLVHALGRDAVGASIITDVVGQEILKPLSIVLEKNLKKELKNHLQEGLKYASQIYPLVLLSLYAHPDSPVTSQVENLGLRVANEVKSFAAEYNRHFKDLYPKNSKEWQTTVGNWRASFPLCLEQVWRARAGAGAGAGA